MVMLGKTNTDEFAMGSSTENSGYFTTHNPWDLDRVPGGSSGGSGAAVSAQMALAALGTDTGGSVRLPASYCGVVGLKPSYGRVSRYGLIAYGSSLDQIGVLAKDVRDAALVLQVMAGQDACDSTSLTRPMPDYSAALDGRHPRAARRPAQGVFHRRHAAGGRDCGAQRRWRSWQRLGAQVVPISLPNTDKALPVYYLVATAEASANLARFDGVRFGYSADADSHVRELPPVTRRGLWRRGQAAHHARHLCPERRLLRRLLSQGAAGAHADQAGFRAGLCGRWM